MSSISFILLSFQLFLRNVIADLSDNVLYQLQELMSYVSVMVILSSWSRKCDLKFQSIHNEIILQFNSCHGYTNTDDYKTVESSSMKT